MSLHIRLLIAVVPNGKRPPLDRFAEGLAGHPRADGWHVRISKTLAAPARVIRFFSPALVAQWIDSASSSGNSLMSDLLKLETATRLPTARFLSDPLSLSLLNSPHAL